MLNVGKYQQLTFVSIVPLRHHFTIKIKNNMTKKKMVYLTSQGFVVMSVLCLLSVSIMAFYNPQSVMDLVQVTLPNNDAFSSIRGIYGGAGLALSIGLLYLLKTDTTKALAFLAMLWGFYALSRIITILVEGALGSFGTQWLFIESSFCVLSLLLLILNRKSNL